MPTRKCTECSSTDTVAGTKEQMDKAGRLFYLPCWFCEDCYHEEPVDVDVAEEWCRKYYDDLPTDIRPRTQPTRSPTHRETTGLGAADE